MDRVWLQRLNDLRDQDFDSARIELVKEWEELEDDTEGERAATPGGSP